VLTHLYTIVVEFEYQGQKFKVKITETIKNRTEKSKAKMTNNHGDYKKILRWEKYILDVYFPLILLDGLPQCGGQL